MARPWNDMMAIGPAVERANGIFLAAKAGDEDRGRPCHNGGAYLWFRQVRDRGPMAEISFFAMSMDQNEIADTAAILNKAEAILTGLGQTWKDTDKLFRHTIAHLVSNNQDYVQSEDFQKAVLDHGEHLSVFEKRSCYRRNLQQRQGTWP